jgi:hypothetical protein
MYTSHTGSRNQELDHDIPRDRKLLLEELRQPRDCCLRFGLHLLLPASIISNPSELFSKTPQCHLRWWLQDPRRCSLDEPLPGVGVLARMHGIRSENCMRSIIYKANLEFAVPGLESGSECMCTSIELQWHEDLM